MQRSSSATVLLGSYVVGVNAASAGLFYYDKQKALRHEWRVRESTLQLSALVGGWIGGLWAMQTFRHKTKKQSFLNVYYSAMAGNILGTVALVRTRAGRQIMAELVTKAGSTGARFQGRRTGSRWRG